MPIMVMSIFAAGSALTHLLSFPRSSPPSEHGPCWEHRRRRTHLRIRVPRLTPLDFHAFLRAAPLGSGTNDQAPSSVTVQTSSLQRRRWEEAIGSLIGEYRVRGSDPETRKILLVRLFSGRRRRSRPACSPGCERYAEHACARFLFSAGLGLRDGISGHRDLHRLVSGTVWPTRKENVLFRSCSVTGPPPRNKHVQKVMLTKCN